MRQTHTWRSWENPLWSAGKLHTCTLLQQLLHLKVICYFNSWSAETVSQRRRFVALRFRWKWLYYSPIYLKVSIISVKTFKTRQVLNNTKIKHSTMAKGFRFLNESFSWIESFEQTCINDSFLNRSSTHWLLEPSTVLLYAKITREKNGCPNMQYLCNGKLEK